MAATTQLPVAADMTTTSQPPAAPGAAAVPGAAATNPGATAAAPGTATATPSAAAADTATETSPPKKSDRKTDRKVINSEGRQIVARVYHFLKNEAENGVCRVANARWRTAQATGISERTVTQILKEEKNLSSTSGKFVNPMSRRKKRIGKTDVDSFSAQIVRGTIEEYKAEHNKLPSLGKLKQILSVRIQFNGSPNTLRRMLLKLGLEWRRLPCHVKRRPRGTVPPKEPKGKRSTKGKKASLKNSLVESSKNDEAKESPSGKQSVPQTSAFDQRLYPMPFAPQFNIFNTAASHSSYNANYAHRPQYPHPVYPMHRVQDPVYSPPSHSRDSLVEHNKRSIQYQDNRANPRTSEQCDISTLLK